MLVFNPAVVSRRVQVLSQTVAPLTRFLSESTWAKSEQHHRACDFTFGNPHEMPLALYMEALQKSSNPLMTDWFAYKQDIEAAQLIGSVMADLVLDIFLQEPL